ncbi:MAG: hypothetical protein ACOZQL_22205 [Myxococcota bacterium]
MARPRPWTVHQPGPLTQRAPHVWTVDDLVPGLPGATRRMVVVRRPDGSLVFFNAIPVPEATLQALRALGRPGQLLVPNQFHALDAPAFALKLDVPAFAPEVAVAALADRMKCQPATAFPAGEGLRLFTVEGFRTKELVLLAGDTLVTADLVTNSPHERGFFGVLMRVLGFTGDAPKLPKFVRRRVEVDSGAVKRLLLELAEQPGLTRLIPSHGTIIDLDAPAALRRVAESL